MAVSCDDHMVLTTLLRCMFGGMFGCMFGGKAPRRGAVCEPTLKESAGEK